VLAQTDGLALTDDRIQVCGGQDMTKRGVLFLEAIALVLALPAAPAAQGGANFSGTWKLQKAEPLPTGRGGGGAGAGGVAGSLAGRGAGAAIDENAFGAVTQTVVITQTPTGITIQTGPRKSTYTIDGKTTVVPPGDVNGLKTWAHWDGAKLHVHFKQGMNWGRDILSLDGGTLSIVRDIESGGGSTTRTIVYAKVS
jgi:hypothetical protein